MITAQLVDKLQPLGCYVARLMVVLLHAAKDASAPHHVIEYPFTRLKKKPYFLHTDSSIALYPNAHYNQPPPAVYHIYFFGKFTSGICEIWEVKFWDFPLFFRSLRDYFFYTLCTKCNKNTTPNWITLNCGTDKQNYKVNSLTNFISQYYKRY